LYKDGYAFLKAHFNHATEKVIGNIGRYRFIMILNKDNRLLLHQDLFNIAGGRKAFFNNPFLFSDPNYNSEDDSIYFMIKIDCNFMNMGV
jgi:hypothetical protein